MAARARCLADPAGPPGRRHRNRRDPARFDDTSPAFTLDGKYLAFLSNRAFDPVYDAHVLDLGFLLGVRPYLVPLLATTPSPFVPELNGRPVEPEGPGEVPATGTTDTEPPPAGLDVAGLAERIVPFPVEAGRYDKLRAARTAWSGWSCRAPGSWVRP